MPRLLATLLLLVSLRSAAQGLVGVAWGQSAEYAACCPVISGAHAQPGCVAVAMAQCMAAYQSPAAGTGTAQYTTKTYGIDISEELTGDIPWAQITGGDREAVARLIYHCGAAAHTDYRPAGSTADVPELLRALVEHFGYDSDLCLRSRECYSAADWEALIGNEIQAGRPVIMHARDPQQGTHAFVIDGITPDGTVHVNWGWGGTHDGWYRLDALSPGPYRFTAEQRIVVGITPDDGRETLPHALEATLTLSDTTATVGLNDDIRGSVSIANRAYRPFSGKYEVTLTAPDGTRRKLVENAYIFSTPTNNVARSDFHIAAPTLAGRYTLSVTVSPWATLRYYTPPISGPTAITAIPATTIAAPFSYPSSPTPRYDAAGRRATRATSGIIITGGRKHLDFQRHK